MTTRRLHTFSDREIKFIKTKFYSNLLQNIINFSLQAHIHFIIFPKVVIYTVLQQNWCYRTILTTVKPKSWWSIWQKWDSYQKSAVCISGSNEGISIEVAVNANGIMNSKMLKSELKFMLRQWQSSSDNLESITNISSVNNH